MDQGVLMYILSLTLANTSVSFVQIVGGGGGGGQCAYQFWVSSREGSMVQPEG